MGLGGISIWQLLIILAIVVLLFGTKKLRNLGSDLGSAVKSFKGAVQDGEAGKPETLEPDDVRDSITEEARTSADASAESKKAEDSKSS